MDIPSLVQDVYVVIIPHSQKWWVLCSFAYLRWRRRDVCNFLMIYIDDIIHNCMCVIFWTWKWYIESSWIKWNKNWWKQLNIRGSWTKWKSEATNPFIWNLLVCFCLEKSSVPARSFSQGGPPALFQVTPCALFMTPCAFFMTPCHFSKSICLF